MADPDRGEPFPGDGEMARRMRALDWTATPLGAPAGWSQSLKTAVRLMLGSRYPMFVWWGEGLTKFYNDAYIPVLGQRHPAALGQPASQVWHEIWDTLGPQTTAVLREGRSTWNERLLLVMERYGYVEETYFTFSYSPAPGDDGGAGGVFCACTEDTERVLGERRLQTLAALARATLPARSVAQACALAADALAASAHDLPFVLLYLLDADGRAARLTACTGLEPGTPAAPARLALSGEAAAPACWPLATVLASGEACDASAALAACGPLVAGHWPEPLREALALPLARASGDERPTGVLIAGISPRRPLDAAYRDFLALVAGQVSNALSDARAFEQERRRAEALAEIDRAKTAFFTNVSHEFRTPLALMLAPLEDLTERLPPGDAHQLAATARRNAQRLLKLVNTLLDFARVEGGRAEARYEPVDLAAYTAGVASSFRAACERAGLELVVDCRALPEPAWIDRDMWEKIVLNLLSNAFKFTLQGGIAVRLRADGADALLEVQDTGSGIAAEDLPRLFQRFSRIGAGRGRSFEGSGIGLALVHELVRLHGGSIAARSTPGDGSTFAVRLPLGRDHLPAERVSGTADVAAAPRPALAGAYVAEALHWLPEDAAPPADARDSGSDSGYAALDLPEAPAADRPRVLVADDNADLRDYLARLLGVHWAVECVADGEAAVAAALAEPPALLLCDVMMPRLDGFGVLARLRADARTRTLPVILLSARAGAEARVEGLQAGADDYLVKPFRARELQARVAAHLAAAGARREAEAALRASEQRLRLTLEAVGAGTWELRPSDDAAQWSPELYRLFGFDPAVEPASVATAVERMHADDRPRLMPEVHRQLAATGRVEVEFRLRHPQRGWRWFHASGSTVEPDRVLGITRDVTERRLADEAAHETAERLSVALAAAQLGSFKLDLAGGALDCTPQYKANFGLAPDARPDVDALMERIHADDRERVRAAWRRAVEARDDYAAEYRVLWPDGSLHWLLARGRVAYGEDGTPRQMVGVTQDITERKRAEAALRDSEQRFRELADTAPAVLWLTDADNRLAFISRGWFDLTGQSVAEAYDRGYGWTDAVHPDDRPQSVAQFADAAARAAPFAIEYRLQRADGSWRWAIDMGRPRLGDGGALLGYIGSVIDVHESVEARRALREADRRKDEFLATLAHELRNPLAPIRNALHLLRLAGTAPATERLHEMLERQVGHMVRLVDDLLEVSRISRGAIELQREPLELATVLRTAVETSRPLIEQAGHAFDLRLPLEPLPVEGDAVRLAQVFANLLNNAAKYTDAGGRIALAAWREDGQAVVEVQDSGIGIAADQLPRLFGMFAQIEGSSARAQGGLGIGLALVQRLVQLHGGSVAAASDGLGRGSRFTVRLPLAAARGRSAAAAAAAPAAAALAPRRLLVVDDNADAADSLGMLLGVLGCEVRVEHDGAAALDALAAWQPSVALLDLGMPVMDGCELARRIRARPDGARVTLVAVSGWGQDSDRQRTRAAGFDHHLVKPVDLQLLQALLASLGPARSG